MCCYILLEFYAKILYNLIVSNALLKQKLKSYIYCITIKSKCKTQSFQNII